jgi:hypothetical protein
MPPKQALKDELMTLVEDDLRALERVQRATAEEATHPEAKPAYGPPEGGRAAVSDMVAIIRNRWIREPGAQLARLNGPFDRDMAALHADDVASIGFWRLSVQQ